MTGDFAARLEVVSVLLTLVCASAQRASAEKTIMTAYHPYRAI
jgi:hypothetical protein